MSVQDYIETLKSVALAENIKNPEVLDFKSSEKGDGYLGQMKFIEIKGSDRNLHVILKTAPQQPEMRENVSIKEIFECEILMYTEINPALQALQEGLADPFKTATCYKTSLEPPQEFLILENLKKSGYTMWDRKTPMDREHVEFTFRQYAKLHASSRLLYQSDPEKLRRIIDINKKLLRKFFQNDENNAAFKKLLLAFKEGEPEILKNGAIDEKFDWLLENFTEVFLEAFAINEDCVLCHGDCWCNNMMFKYNDGKLIDMKLIDFQVIKYANPVTDLVYFLYASTSRDVYENYRDLLKIYYAALTEHAGALGYEIPMSFGKLVDYWRRHAKLGLLLTFMINKVLLAEGEDDTADVAKTSEEGGGLFDAFNYKGKNDDEYRRRIALLIQHCYDNDLL